MKIASGKVKDGKIVVEGAVLTEGSTVTVLATEAEESFEVSDDEEAGLLEALSQIQSGEFVDGDEFLREVRHKR